MAETKDTRGQVTGFVRNKRAHRDGTITFAVSGKRFRKLFLVSRSNGPSVLPENNQRVTVLFLDGQGRYPQIERVLFSPSGEQVSASVMWAEGKADLPY